MNDSTLGLDGKDIAERLTQPVLPPQIEFSIKNKTLFSFRGASSIFWQKLIRATWAKVIFIFSVNLFQIDDNLSKLFPAQLIARALHLLTTASKRFRAAQKEALARLKH